MCISFISCYRNNRHIWFPAAWNTNFWDTVFLSAPPFAHKKELYMTDVKENFESRNESAI